MTNVSVLHKQTDNEQEIRPPTGLIIDYELWYSYHYTDTLACFLF